MIIFSEEENIYLSVYQYLIKVFCYSYDQANKY